MPDKTEKKQRKFRKGDSGNPLGRPRGTRNKATIAAEALLEGETAWFDLPGKIGLQRWKLSNQRIKSGSRAYLTEKQGAGK